MALSGASFPIASTTLSLRQAFNIYIPTSELAVAKLDLMKKNNKSKNSSKEKKIFFL